MVLVLLLFAHLYAASGAKDGTVPANALGQLITTGAAALASSSAAATIVMTVVAHTILDLVFCDTWAGKPRAGTVEKSEG
jgi:hypothetical protein